MTLEALQNEMIKAMKNKDKLRKAVLAGMVVVNAFNNTYISQFIIESNDLIIQN